METTKVLVVDDDETVLRIVSSYLNRSGGYEVISTCSSQEALEIVRRSTIELLISDIMMPGMLGSRLFQEIKQISPDIACILISGYQKEMHNFPPDIVFLKKPFNSEELLSAIKTVRTRTA